MRAVLLRFTSAFILLALFAGRADAASVTLAWDRNTEPDVGGYIVAYGTAPGRDDGRVDVGKATTWTLGGGILGTTYYFRVYAYNAAGVQSAPSALISTTVTGAPSTFLLNRGQVNFAAVRSGSFITALTPAQSVVMTSSPGSALTVIAKDAWIAVSPAGGTGTVTFTVGLVPGSIPTTPGTHEGAVIVRDVASSTVHTIWVMLRVYAGRSAAPVGAFDTPVHGAVGVNGAIPVTGWALDDVETTSVAIFRDAVSGDAGGPSGLVFIGYATFVQGARPDVESWYTNLPLKERAGWGFMLLTNMLPDTWRGTPVGGNGTFRLHAYAIDGESNVTYLGAKQFTAENRNALQPFGTIDTPAQGETISGTFVNFGWALSPAGTIPPDGSTIQVYIDGVAVGQPSYNVYRPDIATAFPAYPNSMGAIGHLVIDTTKLADGVHTISWAVTDNVGNSSGIGSRFFTVVNGTPAQGVTSAPAASGELSTALSVEGLAGIPDTVAVVAVKRPTRTDSDAEVVHPDDSGEIRLQLFDADPIEVRLAGRFSDRLSGTYAGFLVVGNEMRPLPPGSSLDPVHGVFAWQPGAGFLGKYQLVFVRTLASGFRTKVRVEIDIVPKFDRRGERSGEARWK